MLRQVTEAETSLGKERDELKKSVDRTRSLDYDPLHGKKNTFIIITIAIINVGA